MTFKQIMKAFKKDWEKYILNYKISKYDFYHLIQDAVIESEDYDHDDPYTHEKIFTKGAEAVQAYRQMASLYNTVRTFYEVATLDKEKDELYNLMNEFDDILFKEEPNRDEIKIHMKKWRIEE